MVENSQPVTGVVEPPRGTFTGRIDDKGRLKLPAAFQQYLKDLGEEKVFITTLDLSTIRLYPISVWKKNEEVLDGASDDPDSDADIAFLANAYGGDSEIDGQGRVLVPQTLRRKLEMEDQPVWLDHMKGRINVYGKDVFESRLQRASDRTQDKLRSVEKRGFK